MKNFLFVFVCFSALVSIALSQCCQNDCSGHGFCRNSTCYCDMYYQGSDCAVYDEPLYNERPVSSFVTATEWKYFDTNATYPNTTLTLVWGVNQKGGGDCDLYIQRNAFPNLTSYIARDITTEDRFHIKLDDQPPGVYFAGVYGYSSCNFTIAVNVTTPYYNGSMSNSMSDEEQPSFFSRVWSYFFSED
mmetsp:Transcript_20172/g.27823  ORF Transcript_20172/g.27823 Transcript_20172/m.27823 type:complete len:189 (+) Transcript_20172:33-599(+)